MADGKPKIICLAIVLIDCQVDHAKHRDCKAILPLLSNDMLRKDTYLENVRTYVNKQVQIQQQHQVKIMTAKPRLQLKSTLVAQPFDCQGRLSKS
jgi:argonaute-like protein implicated in RNA metabolism and viral defense